jgi:hypothetical protein
MSSAVLMLGASLAAALCVAVATWTRPAKATRGPWCRKGWRRRDISRQ